jgi:hypothetical protein
MALTFASCGARTHYPAGGYPYPEHFTEKDTNFYFYPVRDKFSRQDREPPKRKPARRR